MSHSEFAFTFGPRLLGPNCTRFRFWAPDKQDAALEIDGLPPQPMQRKAGGWFEADADCGPGARYRFRLDDGLGVPDPASRAQAGDIHDPSIVVDPQAYRWRHDGWRGRPWHETVLYEFHAGAFGGFRKSIERLAALAELGVTAI
ncbi:MAG: malto-oligosyltrehalose trehalohydrolase, partial [Burkholderiaceae bacterium]